MGKETHYRDKEKQYFSHVRRDVVSLLPSQSFQKVLEIGAGMGDTLLYIKRNKLAAEVMGVELVGMPGSNQQDPLIDKFQIADIEKDSINAPKEYFDVVICADVLEHLVDPWICIVKVCQHLKKGGLFIASVPNIRECRTLYNIIFRGDFKYDPRGGILDNTHLRFFCKKNILQLISSDSLSPIYCKPVFLFKEVPLGRKRRIINRLTLGLFVNFLTVQYICVAEKK